MGTSDSISVHLSLASQLFCKDFGRKSEILFGGGRMEGFSFQKNFKQLRLPRAFLLLCLVLMLFFQNCGRGFRVMDEFAGDENSPAASRENDGGNRPLPDQDKACDWFESGPSLDVENLEGASFDVDSYEVGSCALVPLSISMAEPLDKDLEINFLAYDAVQDPQIEKSQSGSFLIKAGSKKSEIVNLDLRGFSGAKMVSVVLTEVRGSLSLLGPNRELDLYLRDRLTEPFKQVALGGVHSCGLTMDKTVRCWGGNQSGGVGLDPSLYISRTQNLIQDLGPVVQVVVGYNHSCALLEEGRVKCWGRTPLGVLGRVGEVKKLVEPVPDYVQGLSEVASLSAGYFHTCALKKDKTVWCWGNNWSSQLGSSNFGEFSAEPKQVPNLSEVSSLDAGAAASCATLQDGAVWCWGYVLGWFGQTEQKTLETPKLFEPLRGKKKIRLGGDHACALDDGGQVYCWGANRAGQLGLGNQEPRPGLELVPGLSKVKELSVGYRQSCATLEDGRISCWGEGPIPSQKLENLSPKVVESIPKGSAVIVGYLERCHLNEKNLLYCSGTGPGSLKMPGSLAQETVLIPAQEEPLENLVDISAPASSSSCFLNQKSEVFCLGHASTGYSVSFYTELRSARRVKGLSGDLKSLAAGVDRACALQSEEGGVVCWGQEPNKQWTLGDGLEQSGPGPVLVKTASGENLKGITKIFAGDVYTCGVHQSGQLYCWGGWVRENSRSKAVIPYAVPIENVSSVTEVYLNSSEAFILNNQKQIYRWSMNDPNTANKADATSWIQDFKVNQVSRGGPWLCFTEGENLRVVCAYAPTPEDLEPGAKKIAEGTGVPFYEISKLSGIVELVGSGGASGSPTTNVGCGLKTNGEVWCWGDWVSGILAKPEVGRMVSPTLVAQGAKKISVGPRDLWYMDQQNRGHHVNLLGDTLNPKRVVNVPQFSRKFLQGRVDEETISCTRFQDPMETLWCEGENYGALLGGRQNRKRPHPVPVVF